MCLELKIHHDDTHALDAFPIVPSEVERVVGYLHTRNKLACGAAALRPFAMMTAFRSERSRVENLERTVELARALRRTDHLVLALAGRFDLAPEWLDDEDARWIPARRELAHEHGLIVVARKGLSAAAFEDQLLGLLRGESFRQEAVALLGGGDVGVRLVFRDGRRERLGLLSWERLGDAYSRLRHGTAEIPFEVMGMLRPSTREEGKASQQLGLSRVPQDWRAKTHVMIRDFAATRTPPRRQALAREYLATLIADLATPGPDGHRPAFAVLADAERHAALSDGSQAHELRARVGAPSNEGADEAKDETLLLLGHVGPLFPLRTDGLRVPLSYADFAAALLALARHAKESHLLLCDGVTLRLVPTDGGMSESFGTSLTPESLRRACARLRGRGDRDFELVGSSEPRARIGELFGCVRKQF